MSSSTPERSVTYSQGGIDGEELFRYTAGRWLINEKQQLTQRYVKFDVDNLCQRAASLLGASMVSRIDKMEGNFNKALLLTMDDKRQVIRQVSMLKRWSAALYHRLRSGYSRV